MTNENPITEQSLEELASTILARVATVGYQDIVKSHWASQSIRASKEKSGIKQVYMFIRPEYVVAEAIALQEDPQTAVDDWLASINAMLSEVRKARRESALFDYSEVAQKLDWQVSDIYSHVYLAFARLFLVEAENIPPVLSELEASSIPLLDLPEHSSFQFDVAVDQYRDELRLKDQYQKQCDQLANVLAIKEEENDKLTKGEAGNKKAIEELQAVNADILKKSEAHAAESKQLLTKNNRLSSELEVQQQKTKKLTDDIASLSVQLKEEKNSRVNVSKELEQTKELLQQVEGDLEKSNRESADLAEENELHLIQLHQVQEELESYYLKLKEEKEIRLNVSKELEQSKKLLQQAEKGLEKSEQDSAERAEENELLLLQLHQVQEELEHYFLKLKDMEASQQRDDELDVAADEAEEQPSSSVNQEKTMVQKISKKLREKKAVSIIRKSPLFDSKWYLEQYSDVAEEDIDPAYHYYRFGYKEGRDPGPDFSTTWYLENYPDVYHADSNPLLHYIQFGEEEQRMKNPRDQFPGL